MNVNVNVNVNVLNKLTVHAIPAVLEVRSHLSREKCSRLWQLCALA